MIGRDRTLSERQLAAVEGPAVFAYAASLTQRTVISTEGERKLAAVERPAFFAGCHAEADPTH